MSTEQSAVPGPELVWVGHGAWVARDPELPDHDPRRVIAYLEHRNHRVDVVWVRERRNPCSFETLREALAAVAAVCGRTDEEHAEHLAGPTANRVAETVR